MKKSLLSLLLVLASTASLLVSCKKDAEPDQAQPAGPGYTTTELSGAIVLPSGSPRDVNTLHLVSPIAAGSIAAGRYQLRTIKDDFTTQIAADAAEAPILMGYAYPGQTNFDINARSTVLALLMNTPAVSSLTPAGKVALAQRLPQEASFAAAATEVEAVLRSGRALLDVNNTTLAAALNTLFTEVARRGTSGSGRLLGIIVDRSGPQPKVIFNNLGATFTHAVGVYKNGSKVSELTVDGYQVFPTSLAEVVGQIANTGPQTVQASHTFSGDGDYEIKARTGRPINSDGSAEHFAARQANFTNAALTLFKVGVPWLKGSCLLTLKARIAGLVVNSAGLNSAQTPAQVVALINEVLSATLGLGTDFIKDCVDAGGVDYGAATSFMHGLSKYFTFLNVVGSVGNGANLSFFAVQWLAAPTAIDTCFRVTGATVGPCAGIHLTIVSGNNQTGPANRALPNPVRVRVLDENNNPRSGVSVTFSAAGASGAGSATPPLTTSDANGYAQASWTLGSSPTQRLTATARDATGQPVPGATVDFSATAQTGDYGIRAYGTGCCLTNIRWSVSIPGVYSCSLSPDSTNVGFNQASMQIAPGTYQGTVSWQFSGTPSSSAPFSVYIDKPLGGQFVLTDTTPPSPDYVTGIWGSGTYFQVGFTGSTSGQATFTLRVL